MPKNLELLRLTHTWLTTPQPGQPGFDMGHFAQATTEHDLSIDSVTGEDPNWCGTTACMAGFVCSVVAPTATMSSIITLNEESDFDTTSDVDAVMEYDDLILDFFEVAKDALGLTEQEANHLFYGNFVRDKHDFPVSLSAITREQAAAEIQRLIDEASQPVQLGA